MKFAGKHKKHGDAAKRPFPKNKQDYVDLIEMQNIRSSPNCPCLLCTTLKFNPIKTPDKTIQTKFTPSKSSHKKSPQTKSFPDPQSFLNSKPKKTPRVLDFEVDTTHSEFVDAKC